MDPETHELASFLATLDPLGIRATRPEVYAEFAPVAHALLTHGYGEPYLAVELGRLRRDPLGTPPDPERDAEAARSIERWWRRAPRRATDAVWADETNLQTAGLLLMGFFWLFVFSVSYRERVLRFNDTLGAWRWVVVPIQAVGGFLFGVIAPLAILWSLL